MKAQEKYAQMSRAERRVAIAKDVIKAIHAKKVQPTTGTYLGWGTTLSIGCTLNQTTAKKSLKLGCEVCARGAMMVTRIAKYNAIEIERETYDSFSREDTTTSLKDAFSEAQLNLIECAFERNHRFHMDCTVPRPGAREAADFCRDINDPEDRLICIMQNIIDHDGEFKPKVKYEIKK